MITTTTQVIREFTKLPVEKFLIVVDEDDNEYVIDAIVQRKIHDDENTWCYALKVKTTNEGCLKRGRNNARLF